MGSCRKWSDTLEADAKGIPEGGEGIKTFARADWNALPPDQQCDIVSQKHVRIRHRPGEHPAVDVRNFLEARGSLEQEVTVIGKHTCPPCRLPPLFTMALPDFSLPTSDDLADRQTSVGLGHVVEQFENYTRTLSALSGIDSGKVLISSITSCAAAEADTLEVVGMGDIRVPPKGQLWYVLNTANARHDCHMDAAGGFTFVRMLRGRKLWMVLVPIDGRAPDATDQACWRELGSWHLFKDIEHLPQDIPGYRWEAVVLEAGDEL